ncbi:hypothetical protein GCM10022224_104440 [Nonomuraea antimicrobica]|uniref:NlpC/P60 family protein n=2 Tax=Nonomuraea antimicrobica TaxID=561173 RepID=A0ABP7EVP8_9ACTN
MARTGIEHGTVRGWRQHQRHRVPLTNECGCREARRRNDQARQAKVANQPPPPQLTPPPGLWAPTQASPALGTPIKGKELAEGDVIVHVGRHYPVNHFVAYVGSLRDELGHDTRTAVCGTWEMAIGPQATIHIVPRDEQVCPPHAHARDACQS